MNPPGHGMQVVQNLSGRIAPGDHSDVFSLHERQFLDGPGEDPLPQELILSGAPKPPRRHARGNDAGFGGVGGQCCGIHAMTASRPGDNCCFSGENFIDMAE